LRRVAGTLTAPKIRPYDEKPNSPFTVTCVPPWTGPWSGVIVYAGVCAKSDADRHSVNRMAMAKRFLTGRSCAAAV
jgi:hypothetical protein